MKKNDRVTCVIDGYSSEGAGVAHADGMAVFVPGTIAGERAELHIVKVQKSYAYARAVQILEPSQERCEPDCPVYPKCGGCVLRHMSYSEELSYKERKVRDALTRIAGVDVPMEPILPSPIVDGYRNRAQFPVAGEPGQAAAGFYRTNSHDVIPTEYCRLQTPEAAAVTHAVLDWMNRFRIPAYNEAAGRGLVRHICVRTSFRGGENGGSGRPTVLTLVAASRSLPRLQELIETVTVSAPSVTGIVLNVNPERTNVILGHEYHTLWGKDTLAERLGELEFTLRPASFFQVNPRQAERLYTEAKRYLTLPLAGEKAYHPERLLDLYCGTGTIGLFCADVCGHVTGVEIVEDAIRDARENARANGIANAEFFCGDAGVYAGELERRGEHFDAVIVDPPRKGLSPEAARTILQLNPQRIVYVSCDPATLARDLTRLAPAYTPRQARAVDMFPRTGHVETVVLLSRKI